MQGTRFVGSVVGTALFVTTAGCSTTSTIYRRNASPMEAEIIGGSQTAIAVEEHGQEVVIARSEITEVDYPGNVHALLGGIFLGYGVLSAATNMENCSSDRYSGGDQPAYCMSIFTPAAVGLGMLIWGLVTNNGAKDAFNDTSKKLPEPTLPPNAGYPPGYAPPPYPPPGYPPGYAPPPYPPPGYPPPGPYPYPPAQPGAPQPGATPPPGAPPPPPPGAVPPPPTGTEQPSMPPPSAPPAPPPNAPAPTTSPPPSSPPGTSAPR